MGLRERRLSGLAAELADGLSAGDPCPVCGSCVHPTPAMTTDFISQADIDSAEADQTRATEALSLVRSTFAAERASRDARAVELEAQSGGAQSGGAQAGGAQPGEAAEGPMMATAGVLGALSAGADLMAGAQAAASALPAAQVQMAALAQDVERLRGLVEGAEPPQRRRRLALAASSRVQSQTARAEVTSCSQSMARLALAAPASLPKSPTSSPGTAGPWITFACLPPGSMSWPPRGPTLVAPSSDCQRLCRPTVLRAWNTLRLPRCRLRRLPSSRRSCEPPSSSGRRQRRCWHRLM